MNRAQPNMRLGSLYSNVLKHSWCANIKLLLSINNRGRLDCQAHVPSKGSGFAAAQQGFSSTLPRWCFSTSQHYCPCRCHRATAKQQGLEMSWLSSNPASRILGSLSPPRLHLNRTTAGGRDIRKSAQLVSLDMEL